MKRHYDYSCFIEYMEIVVLKYDSKIENKGKQFLLKITNLCKDDDVLNIIQLLLFF